MLVVLADDFSGAAEIAGIALRYGLSSEVQLDFDRTTKADLVVLDTDTRGSSEEEAVKKLSAIATTLNDAGLRIYFKKIDSVLRGHLVPEIDALQRVFQFTRAIIMSANPVRGRKIISGSYYVNGQSLEQTVFAKDPSFPTATASVEKIISKKKSLFNQVHVSPGDKLPTSSLITGDVSSKEDLEIYAGAAGENDLCCGAAEFFEAFLENKGFVPDKNFTSVEWPPYTVVISGSTVRKQFEKDLQKYILHIPLTGAWTGDEFVLEKQEELAWQNEVLMLLKKNRLVYISILQEVKQVKNAAEIFSGYFVRLVKILAEDLGKANIHFALTGGATASAIIRETVGHGLFVKKEIAPGIVTLTDQAANILYSVKPGSYLWPASFLESFINQTKIVKRRPILGISAGDPAGIGPEITAKALMLPGIYEICKPLVVCDAAIMEQIIRLCGFHLQVNRVEKPSDGKYEYGIVDVLDMKNIDMDAFAFNTVSAISGKASFEYVAKVIELAMNGSIDATITGPIHKEAIQKAGYHYAGHTEIYGDLTGTKDYAMMLADGDFRVVHVSTHVSLLNAIKRVKKERVLKVIELANEALKRIDIAHPKIAVAGLNPHAGENGLFGREEIDEITPAIEAAKELGINAEGPFPPDTIFPKMRGGQYDITVCMYHDQGHIPTKLLGFNYNHQKGVWEGLSGVNITLGLPIIRVSVDHGVAFDKGGKCEANADSMIQAIKYGTRLSS